MQISYNRVAMKNNRKKNDKIVKLRAFLRDSIYKEYVMHNSVCMFEPKKYNFLCTNKAV